MARVTHDAADRDRAVAQTRGATSERSARRADAVRNRTAILEPPSSWSPSRALRSPWGRSLGWPASPWARSTGTSPTRPTCSRRSSNEYVEALADDAQSAWERVEAGRSDAAQELLGFLQRALEMIARSHAAKSVAQALGAEVEYAEPETRATEALGRLIEAGRSSGRLRRDLTVSDLYILMVFYPGDGSAEVRRRWLELIRPGLLGCASSDS